jgi:hypothetical protein
MVLAAPIFDRVGSHACRAFQRNSTRAVSRLVATGAVAISSSTSAIGLRMSIRVAFVADLGRGLLKIL